MSLAPANACDIFGMSWRELAGDAHLEQLRIPVDRVQRRPQLVTHDGEEVGFRPVRPLRLGARGAFGVEQPEALRLGLLALVDVDDRPDVPQVLAARTETWRGGIDGPAIDAVGAADPVVEVVGDAPGIRAAKGLVGEGAVVGMDRVAPAEPEGGCRRLPGELVPLTIQVDALAGGIRDPDHDGSVVRHVPESCFALRQRFGRSLLGRDVDGDAVEADGPTVVIVRRVPDRAHPAFLAGCGRLRAGNGPVLDIVRRFGGDRVPDRVPRTLSVVGVEPIVEGLDGDDGIGRQPEMPLDRRVPLEHVERQVAIPEPDVDGGEHLVAPARRTRHVRHEQPCTRAWPSERRPRAA